MSNIAVRQNGRESSLQQRPAAREWDPFRVVREMMRWDPFREMMPLASDEALGFVPAFDVKETPTGFTFKADMPGIKEKDVEVTITGDRLGISGKRETEKKEGNETYYLYERSYGSFARSFTLPKGVDTKSLTAELKDGVLTIQVAKGAETQPKKIPVTAGSEPKSAAKA